MACGYSDSSQHVRRLDDQRQTLQRDGLVAPVELVGFAGRQSSARHKGVRRRPCLLVAPRFGETMHAVIARHRNRGLAALRTGAASDRRSRRGSLASFLKDLGQNFHPRTELRRRLHAALYT